MYQYFHARRYGFDPLDTEAALAAEPERLKGAAARLPTPSSSDYSHHKHSYVKFSRHELLQPAGICERAGR